MDNEKDTSKFEISCSAVGGIGIYKSLPIRPIEERFKNCSEVKYIIPLPKVGLMKQGVPSFPETLFSMGQSFGKQMLITSGLPQS